MKLSNERVLQVSRVCLRFALGVTFLVAIADRFGWLGPPGTKNVSWGDWQHFVQYVAVLNWFVPKALMNALSVLETIIECALGVALLLGIYPRVVAFVSATLLLAFALTMCVALGIVAPELFGFFGGCRRTASGCQLRQDWRGCPILSRFCEGWD